MKIKGSSSPFAFCHAALTILLLVAYPSFGKRKDDVVIMNNGDKFTGEIKALQYGELIFKSSYMKDDVHLDWKEVKAMESQDGFIVGLSDGKRVTGFISKDGGDPGDSSSTTKLKIVAEGTAVDVAASDVIAIGQREVSFWNQLTGSISYGFDFSSGNTATTSSLSADVAFRTTKNSVQLATSSQFGSQANAKDTNRFTFRFAVCAADYLQMARGRIVLSAKEQSAGPTIALYLRGGPWTKVRADRQDRSDTICRGRLQP